MKQDADLDALVRLRIRGLRTSLGWSLDELAARSYLSPSTLSRIETGHRRIALDQLTPIARALGTTLDQLVESDDDADVVIRPLQDEARGMTTWLLSRTGTPRGMTIAKLRVTRKVPARLRVHPGRDWFTVLSGTIVLRLGERTILVRAGEAAEFSTMEPHAFGVREGAAEMLCILDHDGTRTHLGPGGPFPETGPSSSLSMPFASCDPYHCGTFWPMQNEMFCIGHRTAREEVLSDRPHGDSVAIMTDYGKDPQVVPYLLYEDASAAMDWLIRTFGSQRARCAERRVLPLLSSARGVLAAVLSPDRQCLAGRYGGSCVSGACGMPGSGPGPLPEAACSSRAR